MYLYTHNITSETLEVLGTKLLNTDVFKRWAIPVKRIPAKAALVYTLF